MPAFAAAHWFVKVTIFYSFYIKILSKISLTYYRIICRRVTRVQVYFISFV